MSDVDKAGYTYDPLTSTHRLTNSRGRVLAELTDEQLRSSIQGMCEVLAQFANSTRAGIEELGRQTLAMSKAFGLDIRPLEAKNFKPKIARRAHDEFLKESTVRGGLGMEQIQDREEGRRFAHSLIWEHPELAGKIRGS